MLLTKVISFGFLMIFFLCVPMSEEYLYIDLCMTEQS